MLVSLREFVSIVLLLLVFLFLMIRAQDICRPIESGYIENACDFKPNLEVKFSIKKVVSSSNCSILIPKAWLHVKPRRVHLLTAQKGKYYTLVMVDADCTTCGNGTFYLHWIISNIPGNALSLGKVSKGKTIASYEAPQPSERMNPHRIMFFVFEETPKRVKVDPYIYPRANFIMDVWLNFVEKMCGPRGGLQVLCHY